MSRNATILSILGVVVLLAAFWFLGYSPTQDEIAQVRTDTDDTIAQQATVSQQIAGLEEVRMQIPEVEAALAAAESVIPRSTALPATLRQLQLAQTVRRHDEVRLAGRPAGHPDRSAATPCRACRPEHQRDGQRLLQIVDFSVAWRTRPSSPAASSGRPSTPACSRRTRPRPSRRTTARCRPGRGPEPGAEPDAPADGGITDDGGDDGDGDAPPAGDDAVDPD